MKLSLAAVLVMISMLDVARVNAAETTYFLVAEPPGRVTHNDSYVLPLSKKEDIAHARYLISRGHSVFFDTDRAARRSKGDPWKKRDQPELRRP